MISEEKLKDKFLGCFVGLAVGDALGTTHEFKSYKDASENPLTDIVGGGVFNLKPGHFTDDTIMALCLAESLIEKKDFDAVDQMTKYLAWYRDGYNSPKGHCFDIGNSTREAIEYFERTGEPFAPYTMAGGNGAIMRLAPVPMFYFGDDIKLVEMSKLNSMVTHLSIDSINSCEFMSAVISECFRGGYKHNVINFMHWSHDLHQYFNFFEKSEKREKIHEKIVGIAKCVYFQKIAPDGNLSSPNGMNFITGGAHAPVTLETALWGFHNTTNFKDGALKVVNLGGDSDTTGAVYGQIAGAYYGLSGIPKEWVDKIYEIDRIKSYAEKLYELNLARRNKDGQI